MTFDEDGLFLPKVLSQVDFGRVLRNVTDHNRVQIETTDANHMPPDGEVEDAKNKSAKLVYEVAPVGNEVSLEEQMVKASQNTMDYNLMTTLYQKNVRMLKTAMGTAR